MTIRIRKFIGTIALVALLVVYSLTAMVYTATHLEGASWPHQMVIYIVAGLGWVIPGGFLIRWMQRPDPES